QTLARGTVAARLAPYDSPRAEALLGAIKDSGEYNRWLSAAAARLAPTDLPKARQLLDRFRADNSTQPAIARLRVAFAVAREKPDEAVKLVAGVGEPAPRV